MADSHRYVALICSLPAHPVSLFAAQQTPISRIQLDRRLAMLSGEHRRELSLIESVVQWSHIRADIADAELIRRADRIMQAASSEFLREVVRWRLELRTTVSALRYRRAGLALPTNDAAWGYGRWQRLIRRNWNEPELGLERISPWVAEADRFLRENDPYCLERLLLKVVWDYLRQAAGSHYFDFEAVVIYLLRWNVIDRWARYDGRQAVARFDRLLEGAEDRYGDLFAGFDSATSGAG